MTETPAWFWRTLLPGDQGPDVIVVQRKLSAPLTGCMDNQTAAFVRGFQKKHHLEENGFVTKKTAARLGEKATKGLTPGWFHHDLLPGDSCKHVELAREAFGLPMLPAFVDDTLVDAVLRFQSSQKGLKASGKIDKATAVALADLNE